MEKELRELIRILHEKNTERSRIINSCNTSDYNHTAMVHTYNNTLDIIKRLEYILNKN